MQPESPTRILSLMMLLLFPAVSHAQVLGDPVDVGQDFQKMEKRLLSR